MEKRFKMNECPGMRSLRIGPANKAAQKSILNQISLQWIDEEKIKSLDEMSSEENEVNLTNFTS